ncbi:hypothetical protein JX265_011303 [Neoarthrinium moseri]|uniref:Heterokaryon incompatibility domain-containing protein n=1 Tax=Neoarthrinium moseri TaxID=1658444 RepID=A0A9P9WCM5_9PEZI|nr:hypothetical protein JX265_011303 [Neoarthrinium moseri]
MTRTIPETNICGFCASLDLPNAFLAADTHLQKRLRYPSLNPQFETPQSWQQEILKRTATQEIVGLNKDPGFSSNLSESNNCTLCRFFSSIFDDRPSKHLVLTACSSLQLTHWINPKSFFGHGTLLIDQEAVVDNSFITIPGPNASRDFSSGGFTISGAIFRTSKLGHPLRTEGGIWGRIVPPLVDFSVPRTWLDFCCAHHTKHCRRPAQDHQINGFRLINCYADPPTIESYVTSKRYAALSYVWSFSPESEHGITDIILDAIEATKGLGLQYLWVNRLCIDQANEREKLHQISNMDRIYQQAEVTLVAAGERYDGLPGVARNPTRNPAYERRSQKWVRVGTTELTASLPDPIGVINGSTWNRRGWTFQEGWLSRRLLFFTTDQLFWNCQGMTARESMKIDTSLSHLPDKSSEGDWMNPGLFRNRVVEVNALEHSSVVPTISQLQQIRQDISTFTRRDLTHDSDSLLAFKGIIQAHKSRAPGIVDFVLGLPVFSGTLEFDSGKSAFVLSMCDWVHVESPSSEVIFKRRRHLPSWTWAGWHGALSVENSYTTSIASLKRTKGWFSLGDYTPEIAICLGADRELSNTSDDRHPELGSLGVEDLFGNKPRPRVVDGDLWLEPELPRLEQEDWNHPLRFKQPYVVDSHMIKRFPGGNMLQIGHLICKYHLTTTSLAPSSSGDTTIEEDLRSGCLRVLLLWAHRDTGTVKEVSQGLLPQASMLIINRVSQESQNHTTSSCWERLGVLRPVGWATELTFTESRVNFETFIESAGFAVSESDLLLY